MHKIIHHPNGFTGVVGAFYCKPNSELIIVNGVEPPENPPQLALAHEGGGGGENSIKMPENPSQLTS